MLNRYIQCRIFNSYAFLNDDIVIRYCQVAKLYQEVVDHVEISNSKSKSLIFNGVVEFMEKFWNRRQWFVADQCENAKISFSLIWHGCQCARMVGVTSVQLSLWVTAGQGEILLNSNTLTLTTVDIGSVISWWLGQLVGCAQCHFQMSINYYICLYGAKRALCWIHYLRIWNKSNGRLEFGNTSRWKRL